MNKINSFFEKSRFVSTLLQVKVRDQCKMSNNGPSASIIAPHSIIQVIKNCVYLITELNDQA